MDHRELKLWLVTATHNQRVGDTYSGPQYRRVRTVSRVLAETDDLAAAYVRNNYRHYEPQIEGVERGEQLHGIVMTWWVDYHVDKDYEPVAVDINKTKPGPGRE